MAERLSIEVLHPSKDAVSFGDACLAHREPFVIARRYPDLAAERLDRLTSQIASHLVAFHDYVRHAVAVAVAM